MENKDNDLKDTEVLKYILSENNKSNIKRYNFQCEAKDFTAENLSRSLHKYLKKIYNKNIPLQNLQYLDVGCTNINRTIDICKKLGLSKNNIYGICPNKNIIKNQLYNNKNFILQRVIS